MDVPEFAVPEFAPEFGPGVLRVALMDVPEFSKSPLDAAARGRRGAGDQPNLLEQALHPQRICPSICEFLGEMVHAGTAPRWSHSRPGLQEKRVAFARSDQTPTKHRSGGRVRLLFFRLSYIVLIRTDGRAVHFDV